MSEPYFWGESHVSYQIIGSEESDIAGRCLAIGLTGSVAVYKSVDLARLLMRMGAMVRFVATRSALRFVGAPLLEWASGYPVVGELTGQTEHISLAEKCDALIIAPATLNVLADIASLRADNPVTALANEMLGRGKPVLAVPAMHGGMWRRFTAKLLKTLEADGLVVLEPRIEEGRAKYPEPLNIAWWVEAIVSRGQDLKGLRILVTAGPTREHIDPVRVVTNPSSGLMGVSLALEAAYRGARVTLVHGPLSTCIPLHGIHDIEAVETTEDMRQAVLGRIREEGYDVAVYAAAVADYRPAMTEQRKIPTVKGPLELRLEPTPKIVNEAVKTSPSTVHVAFAAETVDSLEELEAKAREKLKRYGVNVIVANRVGVKGTGFASPTNEALIISRDGVKWYIPPLPKRMVARRILDIAKKYVVKR